MKTTAILSLHAILLLPASGLEAALSQKDPAPPRFNPKPESMVVLAPREHPRVRSYRKPRPLASDAVTSDWPHFLGPSRNNISAETRLLDEFVQPAQNGQDPLLVWTLTKGESYSAPSIKGRRLVYMHRIGDSETVECLDAETGEQYWSHDYATNYIDRYRYLNGPRSTAAIDGERVYTLGVQGVLCCVDLPSGHIYWQRKLAEEFELDQDFFGFSTSPLVEGDLLIVNLGLGKCVAAFDKHKGDLKWLSGDEWGRSYATPIAATMHEKRVLFVFAGGMTKPPIGGLLALDPPSGEIHFRFPWRSPRYFSANASSPVISGNKVFISTSYDIGGAMLEIAPDLSYKVAYKTDAFGSHWMTPILHGGYLYGFANARLTCMEWATGKEMWSQSLSLSSNVAPMRGTGRGADQYRPPPGRSGFGIASLIIVDGRYLCLGETGLIAWLDLSPEGYKILSARRLFNAEQTWTGPVLSRGLLYIAQNNPDGNTPPRLLCYDLRAAEK